MTWYPSKEMEERLYRQDLERQLSEGHSQEGAEKLARGATWSCISDMMHEMPLDYGAEEEDEYED